MEVNKIKIPEELYFLTRKETTKQINNLINNDINKAVVFNMFSIIGCYDAAEDLFRLSFNLYNYADDLSYSFKYQILKSELDLVFDKKNMFDLIAEIAVSHYFETM